MPLIASEEEEPILNLSKEELFFRLTGERNLGAQPFIKINQLHQEANVRLSAQIVMNVLIPKKGSKEQIKVEEGRLLYGLIYGKKINLAKLIVERLKGAMGRKSIPICYGMHLMEMIAQAGINLLCANDEEVTFSSAIDHHTLKRLGYRFQHGGWDYVGRGKVNTSFPMEGQEGRMQEEEEEEQEPTQAESAAPSHPIPRSRTIPSSQIPSLATKSDIAHLQQFMVEQFHLLQATLLSKLETMDSRLQICEQHILHQTFSSPIPPPFQPPPSDPKGKAPLVTPIPSPIASPHASPLPTPHIPSPPSPLFQKSPPHDPIPIPSQSSHSSTSSSTSSSSSPSQKFELVARTPSVHSPISTDSEATPSDPLRYLTPQPSPAPPTPTSQSTASTPSMRTKQSASKNPSFTPSPPPSPTLPPSEPTQPPPPPSPPTQPPQPPSQPSSTRFTSTSYSRRKLAITRPGTSPPPHPPLA